MNRICTTCKAEKPQTGFYKRLNGLTASCKSCVDKRNRDWRRLNPSRCASPENRSAAQAKHDLLKASLKVCLTCKVTKPLSDFYVKRNSRLGYESSCKECSKQQSAGWQRENKAESNAKTEKWRRAHLKESATRVRLWARKNTAILSARRAKWRKENPWVHCAQEARRRLQQKMAMPAWANKFFIAEAYHLAALRTNMLGYPWHVDHIVPLQSPIVCGLHVENNLQVIPGSENSKKNNKHWPGMS